MESSGCLDESLLPVHEVSFFLSRFRRRRKTEPPFRFELTVQLNSATPTFLQAVNNILVREGLVVKNCECTLNIAREIFYVELVLRDLLFYAFLLKDPFSAYPSEISMVGTWSALRTIHTGTCSRHSLESILNFPTLNEPLGHNIKTRLRILNEHHFTSFDRGFNRPALPMTLMTATLVWVRQFSRKCYYARHSAKSDDRPNVDPAFLDEIYSLLPTFYRKLEQGSWVEESLREMFGLAELIQSRRGLLSKVVGRETVQTLFPGTAGPLRWSRDIQQDCLFWKHTLRLVSSSGGPDCRCGGPGVRPRRDRKNLDSFKTKNPEASKAWLAEENILKLSKSVCDAGAKLERITSAYIPRRQKRCS